MSWIFTAITAIVATTGASVWSSHYSEVQQNKRQNSLRLDAERKATEVKLEADQAEAKAVKDTKTKTRKRQKAVSNTILTGAEGLSDEADLKKEKLGA